MRWIARLVFVPTVIWNVLNARVLKRYRWWDSIDDHVWLGAMPFTRDVPKLVQAGVRGVINVCAEYRGPVRAYAENGIRQLLIPLPDYTSPTMEQVQRCLAFIEEHVARDEKVYVHCKAGRGRSTTVVLCWLVSARGMSPDQAEALVREKRPQVLRRLSRRKVVQECWGRDRPPTAASNPGDD